MLTPVLLLLPALHYPAQEHPAVRGRTDEQVAAYRAQRQIHVYGEGVPKPCTTFDEASFPGVCV